MRRISSTIRMKGSYLPNNLESFSLPYQMNFEVLRVEMNHKSAANINHQIRGFAFEELPRANTSFCDARKVNRLSFRSYTPLLTRKERKLEALSTHLLIIRQQAFL